MPSKIAKCTLRLGMYVSKDVTLPVLLLDVLSL